MATISKKQLKQQRQYGGKPEGNHGVRQFTLKTTATGAVEGADSAAAIGIGDVVRIGVLARGLQLQDALAIVSTGMTASVTGKLGFAYVDGVDDATVPQDDDYFLVAGAALSTAARLPANNPAVFPVTLPKDAYLILTAAGAANAKASRIDVLVYGEDMGPA